MMYDSDDTSSGDEQFSTLYRPISDAEELLRFPNRHRARLNFPRRRRTTDETNASEEVDIAEQEQVPQSVPELGNYEIPNAAEHTYLRQMEKVPGCGYMEENKIYKIQAISLNKMIFPGEVVPMIARGILDTNSTNAENGIVFGLIFLKMYDSEKTEWYGVTCQVFEKSTNNKGYIKFRALQKFSMNVKDNPEMFERVHNMNTPYTARVKILPEIILPDPLLSVDLGCMNKLRGGEGTDIAMKRNLRNLMASTTPWPEYVYRSHDLEKQMEKAKQRLHELGIENPPNEPIQLSYWLARNLSLCQQQRYKIFHTKSVQRRFELLSEYLNEVRVMCCIRCNNLIGRCDKAFAMSVYGVQSNYCNPGGFIHETTTLLTVETSSIKINGSPESEFSWFPGYSWQMIACRGCNTHMGWKFLLTNSAAKVVPKLFYGISGVSVLIDTLDEWNRRTTEQ